MNRNSRIYIAGHTGMVGSAIRRSLTSDGFLNIIMRGSADLDLRNQESVNRFFELEQPEYVFLAAAKVGGIMANNTYRADFIHDNLAISLNVIRASHEYHVKKLLFLGSSCIYPKHSPQPIKEEYLLTGSLESTNEPYAIAKIAGLKLCEAYNSQYGTNFISVMPSNLYGIGDNYHPEHSHVLPALIRKFHEAQENGDSDVTVWGTGTPFREFLFADDLADACLYLMNRYDQNKPINVGSGIDISIKDLAELIKKITGFTGMIVYDATKPDGTPKKLLDVSRLKNLGWNSKTALEKGVGIAYQDFLNKKRASSERAIVTDNSAKR